MLELMRKRHSVRQYENRPIEEDKKQILNNLVEEINRNSQLNVQIFYDEKEAFNTFMAHYGKFDRVTNYVALIGKKGNDEKIGYYGEQIVLKAQELGLNTCWVAMTYGKSKVKTKANSSEKLYCVLALGYGKNQGSEHKIKKPEQVSNVSDKTPDWFGKGVEASLLARTAMNQQKFKFIYDNGQVIAKAGFGFYTKIDLGTAKCHFELGAGREIKYKEKDV